MVAVVVVPWTNSLTRRFTVTKKHMYVSMMMIFVNRYVIYTENLKTGCLPVTEYIFIYNDIILVNKYRYLIT